MLVWALLLSAYPPIRPSDLYAQCPDGSPPPCAGRAAVAPSTRSVAVLPFENRSRDTADAYLAEALTDRVTTRLAQVTSIQVKARSLVDGQWQLTPNALTAARRLGVAYFVTGRVRRQAGRVSINAQLVRLSTGTETWAGIVEAGGDMQQLESAVAESVATGVMRQLSPGDRAAIARRPTRDSVAYDLYLRAIYHARRYTDAEIRVALDLLTQATRRDSTFAPAWAEIGNVWFKLAEDFADPVIAWEAARSAGERALRLDPRNASGIYTRDGGAALQRTDLAAAADAMQRALAIDPDQYDALGYLTIMQTFLGRDAEAARSVQRFWQIDSLSGIGVLVRMVSLELAGHSDSVLVLARRAVQWQPLAAVFEAGALWALGRCPEVLARPALPVDPAFPGTLAHATCSGRIGVVADSLGAAARGTGRYVAPFHVAEAYALANQPDSVMAWLERAAARQSILVFSAQRSPIFRSVRDDPRFQAFVRRLGPR